MKTALILTLWVISVALHAAEPDFQSQHLAVGLSRSAPAFSVFAVDSLGHGKLDQNPVLVETNAMSGLELDGQTYKLNGKPVWRVTWSERTLTLRSDYVHENHAPEATGEPRLDDGSDGFQFYENGGATGCWSYYTVKALYQLGRVEDARRIFHPMLAGYAAGKFQGFDPQSGRSYDWRDWQGGGHGYEGLLVDNYHALLAVLDDVRARP